MRIFLSYGHDDRTLDVTHIKRDLEARGHEVWFDVQRLHPGIDWERYIEEGLQWCNRVVLMMTPYSVRRRDPKQPESKDGFCLNEIAKAIERNKPIIPVLLAHLEEGPPTSICRIQWLDLSDCIPIANNQARYEARFDRLIEAIEHDSLDYEGGQARLLKYLQPINFDREISTHIGKFTGRRWLLAALDNWLEREPHSRIFWIIGAPGIGKTAIATHLCHRRADIIAHHLCVNGNTDTTDARRTILSIVYQISTQIPEYEQRLQLLNLEAESVKDVDTIFENLVVKPLTPNLDDRDFPRTGPTRIVLIDALDEASTFDGVNGIADLIAQRWVKTPDWLKLVITSRPDAEVVARLQGVPKLNPFVLRAESDENYEDARVFLRTRLAQIGQQTVPAVLETILRKSEGIFLYLTVVLEELAIGRLTLDNLDAFPVGIAAYYQQFFTRRFKNVPEYKSRLRPVLRVIIAQREPLPLQLLARATGLDAQELDEYLQSLGSLFPIRTRTAAGVCFQTIAPFHKSIRDWLIAVDEITGTAKAGVYALDVAAGEALLAQACWTEYLEGHEKIQPYALRHLLAHLASAQRWSDLEAALRNVAFLEARKKLVTAEPAPVIDQRIAVNISADDDQLLRCEHTLREDPTNYEALFQSGVIYAQRGDWERAIKFLHEALPLRSNASAVEINLCLAHCEIGDFTSAFRFGYDAVMHAPQNAKAYHAFGLALEGAGKSDEAIQAYTRGIEINPSESSDLWLTLGNAHGKQGRLTEAIHAFEQAILVNPKNFYAYENIAYVLEEKGDYAAAETYLLKAVDADPQDEVGWYDLGTALKRRGERAKALEYFEKSFSLNPKFYRACVSAAMLHEEIGNIRDALLFYTRAQFLTNDKKLIDAMGRQIAQALDLPGELAERFEPPVAQEYVQFWQLVKKVPQSIKPS